ncbi:C39 family peptidase [Eubacteriales bacterium KG125]
MNGKFYRFDETGAMISGWFYDSSSWYYYDKSSGAKLLGTFLRDNSMLYYLEPNSGIMLSNTERIIDGNNYIFSNSGAIKWGWLLEHGIWYYYNEFGNKITGWFFDKNLKFWYYFNSKGEMLRNSYVDNYWLSDNGEWSWTFSPKYFQQGDYRWGKKYFGVYNMEGSGCVPTSLAMIFNAYDGSTMPLQVAKFLYDKGYYNNPTYGGYGAGGKAIISAANNWNMKNRGISSSNEMRQALNRNSAVIVSVRGGNVFMKSTAVTHDMVAHGIKGNKTYIYDPLNPRQNGWYDIDWIFSIRSLDPYDNDAGYPFIELYK